MAKKRKASNTITDALSIKSRLSELENEQKRYVDAYGKGIMPETLFAEKMKETNRQIGALKIDIAKASENRGVAGKIDVEQLVQKAALKLENLNFDQKKHIVERVVDKIIASPKEIIIWGHLPSPALAAVGKVNHVSQHRHRRTAKCWQVYPLQCVDAQ